MGGDVGVVEQRARERVGARREVERAVDLAGRLGVERDDAAQRRLDPRERGLRRARGRARGRGSAGRRRGRRRRGRRARRCAPTSAPWRVSTHGCSTPRACSVPSDLAGADERGAGPAGCHHGACGQPSTFGATKTAPPSARRGRLRAGRRRRRRGRRPRRRPGRGSAAPARWRRAGCAACGRRARARCRSRRRRCGRRRPRRGPARRRRRGRAARSGGGRGRGRGPRGSGGQRRDQASPRHRTGAVLNGTDTAQWDYGGHVPRARRPAAGLPVGAGRPTTGRAPVLPDACSDLIWQAGRGAFVAGPGHRPVRPSPRRAAACSSARASAPARAAPRSGCRCPSCATSASDLDALDRALAERLPARPRAATRRCGGSPRSRARRRRPTPPSPRPRAGSLIRGRASRRWPTTSA